MFVTMTHKHWTIAASNLDRYEQFEDNMLHSLIEWFCAALGHC